MKIYLVGGAVRDKLLQRPIHERDWVVVGATEAEMLARGFRPVGKDFPVFLHPDSREEYALARTERKSGHGYGGFTVYASPDVTLEEDLQRRDLTVNAMAETPDGEIIDPYNGQADIRARKLRHVAPAFAEDPLRILRVARFAARYAPLGFSVADETMTLMQAMVDAGEVEHLVPERVWKEVSRALTEPRADIFIQVLRDCGALRVLLPEVDRLFGVPQPALHHPEIDTGDHILRALRQAPADLPVRFAVLVHDLGKGITPDHVLPSHRGHEAAGLPLVKAVCQRLRVPNPITALALGVCEYHLHCHKAFELRPQTILKLLRALDALRRPERFEQFLESCEADARGRLGLEDREYPQAGYLRAAREAAAGVDPQALMAQGFEGAQLGKALDRARLEALANLKQTYGAPGQK
ncbi:multifunctional CCA addition/repair protein [Microbulbifer harenosus]|uniref:Multifunctional CCA protein n=1 Tax=Microbulbifer harenosus TaxID=2576840 RepID=A0ABY2UJ73_9GAMM|nr:MULTISPECIES: multifunctional CCA addition/repair protein [Microbulbifer]QIL90327.1 multifunctional CCA addition/repair protein [Microbulbifer sp. SH-1]TLM78167.1 multifunctional CCA addition/repair protein [Microbulbifer harenosus]